MDRLRAFTLPLARPLETASGTIESRRGFLVRVGADPPGTGEATPLPGWTEPLEASRTALRSVLPELEADADIVPESLQRTPAARHAVSLAVADRRARRDRRPLYRSLGGDRRVDTLPVNATLGDGSVGRTVREAQAAIGAGFACLKVKVGARSVDRDVDRVAAVRDAVGPDVDLRVDANGVWTRAQGRRAVDAFTDLGVSVIEQPLDPADLEGHAALRDGPAAIAIDESLASVDPADVMDAGAADALVLKPMVLGGIDRARAAGIEAGRRGIDTIVTTTVDGVVARTAAVHLAASLPDPLPSGLATADRLAADLAPDPAPVSDGRIVVPQTNGSGVSGAWDA